jgi:hypothetical protein
MNAPLWSYGLALLLIVLGAATLAMFAYMAFDIASDGDFPAIAFGVFITVVGILGGGFFIVLGWNVPSMVATDSRPCLASHIERQTTYVMAGKVMVPVTSDVSVCDERGEAS